jgi:hypothetical protein
MKASLAALTFACVTLLGCAEGRQRSFESRSLESGVTSSSGGGQSVLHNQPNVGVTNGGATVTGLRSGPNSPCRTNPSAAGC